ncbi:unnamed protein product [Parnassius mnemosyne]|uniref:Uncharacterized protein n=1 Tax=Parnassius mnemosyne TaxID=213953 RepID=A0AAV1K6T8_9NEOP
MTSAAKLQKDKFYGSAPRLTPRPTATSAARAARNATNRSLTTPATQKSPSRTTSSLLKTKCEAHHNLLKSELTNDVNVNNLQKKHKSKLNAVEMRSLRKMCGVTMADRKRNEEIRNMAGLKDDLITKIDKGVLRWFGHVERMSEDRMVKKIYSAKVNIKRCRESDRKKSEPSSRVSSRPQTPKSLQSGLSRTPRIPSRPSTPANLSQKITTTPSRPNTPHRSSLPRPKNPTALKSSPRNQTLLENNKSSKDSNNDPEDIATIYSTKQREFHHMKKELDMKQQAILEMFNNLQRLQDRMAKEGISGKGEGISKQELVILNVTDWAAEEVSQLCYNAQPSVEGAGEIINTMMPIDENIISQWDAKVSNLSENYADLCLQAFTARQEIIDWVKDIIAKQDAINEEDLTRITAYNTQGLELCDLLRELKNRADESVHGISLLLKKACQERGLLISVGESLVKELARLRQDIELHSAVTKEFNAISAAESETAKALEDTRRELEEERISKATMKEKLATTELQLRQARTRINKMDRQLREAEASITSLTVTVKSLEDQSRQKEVQLEARARKLRESLKTGEMTNNQIMQQRDALENELSKLREQLERNMIENKTTIQDLNNQLRDLKSALEAERKKTQEEMELKNMFEESYRDSLNTIEELKTQIVELEKNKPNPDLPTEREMDLRAELIATKDTLRITEEEVISCKREKVRFLETLTKIAESENKMSMQQKLAAELLNKEEIMSKMQTQIRELNKSIKLNEQKVIEYEHYIRALQTYGQYSSNSQEESNGATYQDLQQEIMQLRMGLLEAVHKNEELSELLMQKEQQLEQQDKTSRAQARVIKVREELINMLKNKESEQSRELTSLQQDLEQRMRIVDEVNKQIAAKADEIQELFSTLENKQQQIHRLEKIVLALEEQQRRAQAQRTRHEEKIAALEHELAAGGNRRDRKFLFF